MKNIHILSTDKPGKLLSIEDRLTIVHSEFFSSQYVKLHGYQYKAMYITSEEEIKEGDWFIRDGSIHKCFRVHKTDIEFSTSIDSVYCGSNTFWSKEYCKKIILTTDQDLIKGGIQPIPGKFLEWFTKNSSCESVKTQLIEQRSHLTLNDWVNADNKGNFPISIAGAFCYRKIYKIIIPKGELKLLYEQIIDVVGGEDRFREIAGLKPKQHVEFINDNIEYLDNAIESFKKETLELEEAAEIYAKQFDYAEDSSPQLDFIAGAKWQAEQDKNKYSEEEVLNLLTHFSVELQRQIKTKEYPIKIKEWFNQFKK